MLAHNSFLLGEEPRFVDFDLFGMLENFLFSGHYELPAAHPHIKEWYSRMAGLKFQREK
jgi:glutathione S-transferase